LEVGFEICK
jgi:hypothetical protein